MGLSGNDEDVRFAWAEATELEAALRAAAQVLDSQRGPRAGWQREASEEFRGRFSELFRTSARTAAADGAELADALRDAAAEVHELARLAREEQRNREQARRWYAEHAHEGLLDKASDLLFGDDDPPPPARHGPSVLVHSPRVAARGGQP